MPAEVADAAEETAADQEDNVEEKREPQSELDENGRDVFEGYSFGTDNASESVEDEQEELEEEEDEDTRLPSTALSEDQVKRHPADLSQALLQSDHLQAPPADKEADNISCSDRSSSSHQSHTDRDLSMQVSGHSTDPSTATSEAHTKEASDPVKQDVQSPPVCSPSQEPVAEIPEAEEDDWDVVEQEVEVAQNGRNIDGRRGIGKTLFQKGVPDRCECKRELQNVTATVQRLTSTLPFRRAGCQGRRSAYAQAHCIVAAKVASHGSKWIFALIIH